MRYISCSNMWYFEHFLRILDIILHLFNHMIIDWFVHKDKNVYIIYITWNSSSLSIFKTLILVSFNKLEYHIIQLISKNCRAKNTKELTFGIKPLALTQVSDDTINNLTNIKQKTVVTWQHCKANFIYDFRISCVIVSPNYIVPC